MPAKKKSTSPGKGPVRSVLPEKAVDLSGVLSESKSAKETPEQVLLAEIRNDYRHYKDYWKENRDEMEVNMRFAGGDAFSANEHSQRDQDERPCETPDELSQYVKQTNNSLRQNKRDSKISPASEDATGQDAEKRGSVLRGLNHRGNFQAVFQTAFEGCTWSGFGFFGIGLRRTKDGHVEPYPRRFPNQFAVLLDPYAKEADYSDQKRSFVIDIMRKSDFAREYKDAQKRSFSSDDARIAPDWVLADEIVIAEAWRVASQVDIDFDSEIKEGEVIQYITNGVEILETIHWPGSWIPVIPILGEEIYISEGGRQKRKYLSLIHRARTSQKMLAFIASQELEEFGMSPRVPFMGYQGQFTSPDWPTINRKPKPYIEIPIIADPLSPEKVLPLPQRPQYVPNAQAYEIAREAWRRGVQSGMGITPLPTAAQRQNQKSGIALEKIANQEAVGSYHFLDNADRALVNYGRQVNELITKAMVKQRQIGIRNQDDSHGLLHITTTAFGMPEGITDPEKVLFVDRGQFDVTVTAGPSKESEREEASDFVDTLLANLKALPVPPQIAQKLLAIAIKLKNVGPLGDEMAKMLDPEEGDPIQQMQKMMAAAQQQQQLMGELQQELQKLQMEKQAKVVDNEYKLKIEEMRHSLEIAKLDNARAIAEIQTKAQILSERQEQIHEVELETHGAGHELALQKDQQVHDSNMTDKNAVIAQAAAAQAPTEEQPSA